MTLEEIVKDYTEKSPLASVVGLGAQHWREIARLYATEKCKEQREICRDEINNFGVDDLPEEYHETSDRMEAFVAEHAPAPKMD